jgi:HK97 family phage portal protein
MGWIKAMFGTPVPAAAAASPPDAAVSHNTSVDLDRLNADLAKQFVRSIYLWRCVDMIASMSASVPLFVYKDEDSQLRASELGVAKLLTRPNPQWTGAALQYYVAASIAVSNKAFLLRVRGAGGVTQELWPIAPTDVTIIYVNGSRMIQKFQVMNGMNGGTGIDEYEVDENGDSDLIYIRRPALNRWTDKSPAAIAAAPAEVFTRVLQRCADIVSNSSNITGLLSTDSELAKGAVAEIKDKITQFRTGQAQSGGTLVTANAKWNLTRLSEDPASALSVEIKDSLARDVAMTFGVPSQLLALPGQDTYNNLGEARVALISETVLPGYINLYVSGLNHALMRNGAEVRPDIEHIPAMMAYRRQLTKAAVEATMLSVNEQREMLGYPPYEDDEMADVPVKLEELKLKRLAIEVQGGNVGNILGPSERGPPKPIKPEQSV